MREVLAQIGDWQAAGERVAIATVVNVIRSAPRPPGTKLALSQSGRLAGAVSGGCVEGAVVAAARELLDDGGTPRLLRFGIADDELLGVGLPCGGEIDVLVEPVAGSEIEGFLAAGRAGGRAALISALDGREHGGKLLLRSDGTVHGSLGSPDLDGAAMRLGHERLRSERPEIVEIAGLPHFCDVVSPLPRLLIFGAVDYAAALCRLAAGCGWRPFVIDPRQAFADPDRFPGAERVLPVWPGEAVAELGGIDPATAIVVLSHDPKLDDAALSEALRSPARYIGAMGSRTSCARREERLGDLGFEAPDLARISAPVGLDLGAGSPEETALSIFAEIVAVTNGRDGGRLAASSGPIHALR
jgi:xanthine dehydrogenase accessory factor